MRIAKRRNWTEAEVDAMARFIQSERPGLWEKLLDLERAGGDLRNEWGETLSTLIAKAHPDCELSEQTDMKVAIRKRLSTAIGPH